MAFLPVKFVRSNMQGAPVISNLYGDMVTALDAILVNGFNTRSITSMTAVGAVITITLGSGHGFIVDQVIAVSGANEAEYNGDWRVTAVTATTAVFSMVSAPVNATATGTMSVKTAGLGWQIAFTGTNKRAYRSPNVLSNRPYLRVDNSLDPVWPGTYAVISKVTAAESMTDIDTFVGARAPFDSNFPTRNEVGTGSGATSFNGWFKWHQSGINTSSAYTAGAGTAVAKEWIVAGDDRTFFFFINPYQNPALSKNCYGFGDYESYKIGDAYNFFLFAQDLYNIANSTMSEAVGNNFNNFTTLGKIIPRDYTQLGGTCGLQLTSIMFSSSIQGSGLDAKIPFPNGPDFGFYVSPYYIKEETRGDIRGTLPGLFFLPQQKPFTDNSIIGNVVGYPNKKFILIETASAGGACRLAVDIFGPWR